MSAIANASPVDYSRAPAPAQKKPEATTSVVVMGDANADWLAHGLEEAFSEKPEIGIVRKHRTDSGLIRYDSRRDIEWAQVAREIIAAEKPKFIVMMIGNNDRQTIRERAPVAARPGAPGARKRRSRAARNRSPAQRRQATQADPGAADDRSRRAGEQPAAPTPEQARQASYGPWEFRSEKWEVAYIRRVDATIAALKTAGVPVLWVGLPSQRGPKASGDSSYLNEIYRSRAEKAGITYVDIWDGFVDEAGRFSPQGPDYEGQIRRLRSGDGVYFTKFGARKLAHYVEREIQRHITNRGVAGRASGAGRDRTAAPGAKPGGPAQRPAVGPVVPLTASQGPSEELLGGGARRRVLRPPIPPPPGADQGRTDCRPQWTRRRFQLAARQHGLRAGSRLRRRPRPAPALSPARRRSGSRRGRRRSKAAQRRPRPITAPTFALGSGSLADAAAERRGPPVGILNFFR